MLIDKKFSFFGWVSLVQGERGLKKNKTSTLCSMRHDSKLIILLLRHPLPTYTYISPKSIELQRKHREIQIKILCFNLSVSLDASLTAVCPGLNFFFSNLKFSYVYKKEKNVWQVAIGKTLKVRFLFKKSHMTCYASMLTSTLWYSSWRMFCQWEGFLRNMPRTQEKSIRSQGFNDSRKIDADQFLLQNSQLFSSFTFHS